MYQYFVMKKRAQVTIFVIIIIVLIIGISVFFYMKNKNEVAVFSATEDVNLKENSPVQIYVEDVTRRLLVDGIFLLGRQGGKIYEDTFPDCQEEDPTYTSDHRMCLQKGIFKYQPVEEYRPAYLSSSSYFFKRINVGINDSRGSPSDEWTVSSKEPLQQPFAYPHHGPASGIDYVYGAQDPLFELTDFTKEHSISNQLNLWIKSQLSTELDFTEFEDRGFEIVMLDEEPQVGVKINEDDVTVLVNYTLEVTRNDKRFIVDEYFVEIDYNFNRLYTFLNRIILADMYTLDNIVIYNMLNKSGEKISRSTRLESDPPNYKYDVIEVTDLSYDWKISENYERQYFKYRFIRENRAADAGTVKYFPNSHFATKGLLTFECSNFQTAGAWFDPDEDDQYTGEFPFSDPQWYQWYSRGDKLIVGWADKEEYEKWGGAGKVLGCPVVEELVYHNQPDNTDYGPSWTSILPTCGNSQLMVSMPTQMDDVGDVIILKVGDQMDFDIGSKVAAPERYPESPILEEGFGRTNDVISFRPVRCEPGSAGQNCAGPSCMGSFWGFNKPQVDTTEEHCVATCEKATTNSCRCLGDPSGTSNCDCCAWEPLKCSRWVSMIWHIDHNGACVPYYHPTGIFSEPELCVGGIHSDEGYCQDKRSTICGAQPDPLPDPMEPSDDSEHKSVCCADAEGQCQDFILPKTESGCGSYHEDWTYITELEFCNEMEECTVGCCNIRGADQPLSTQQHECAALCKDAGVCECSGDLATCVGDFSWSPDKCADSFEYIDPLFETRIVR